MTPRIVTTIVLLVLVCLPRFNMWDPGPMRGWTTTSRVVPWGHPIDVEGYVRLVKYFRGEAAAGELIGPFSSRPLGPALAAAIPVEPITALNLVNLASLIVTLWLLDATCGLLGLGSRARWAAALLFVLSFPTFYYGTIGFVDPVALAASALVLMLVLRGAPLAALVPAIAFGVLAKETNAALALLLIGAGVARRSVGAATIRAAALLAAGLATFLLVQALMPSPGQDLRPLPRLAVAIENLSRPRTYLSLALSIAIPAVLAAVALWTGRARGVIPREALAVLLAGAGLSAGVYVASIFGAYTDGRLIWSAYPFVVPIAATLWDTRERVNDERASGPSDPGPKTMWTYHVRSS